MKIFSVPKYPGQNEDKWFAPEYPFAPIVLCDGASESYNSMLWAETLCKNLKDSGDFNDTWLEKQISRYEKSVDPENLTWSKQLAYERGSFSSFLSVQSKNGHWLVNAMGDTVAFSLNSQQVIGTYPYDRAEQFLDRPLLLSTKKALNRHLPSNYADSPFAGLLDTTKASHIFLLTDALAHWLMKRRDDPGSLQTLLAMETQDQFTAFVLEERKNDLRLDDTTMIAINLREHERKMKSALPALLEE